MEQKGTLLQWKLSLAETISFGITLGAMVFFVTSNFQSKDDAEKLERRIDKLESELSSIKQGITGISVDLAYLKGVLTIKTQDKSNKEK